MRKLEPHHTTVSGNVWFLGDTSSCTSLVHRLSMPRTIVGHLWFTTLTTGLSPPTPPYHRCSPARKRVRRHTSTEKHHGATLRVIYTPQQLFQGLWSIVSTVIGVQHPVRGRQVAIHHHHLHLLHHRRVSQTRQPMAPPLLPARRRLPWALHGPKFPPGPWTMT